MFNNFMPTPIMNAYQSPMSMYAHGGHMHGNHHYPLHHEAEMLRHYGTGHDRILAHINPAEASYLQHHHGMSLNPHTGLPQFGFFDMLKSGASRLGSAAMEAAPGLWQQYGRPLAEQGLSALDTRIQGALPGLGQAVGNRFFGEKGGELGASFGKNLASQFGGAGGLSGQVLPRVDARAGMQNQGPSPLNPMQMAANVGKGVWGDVGRGMAREGLQNVDARMMGALPQMGSRVGGALGGLGNRPGMGSRGAAFGSQMGENLANMYGNTPGISGYAMPRMHQAFQNMGIPTPPPPPAPYMRYANNSPPAQFPPMGGEMPAQMAHGGHMYRHPHHYY